jgi:hypothetical protein
MIDILFGITIMSQKVFAFKRLKKRQFGNNVNLYMNDGAEVYSKIDHPVFQSLIASFPKPNDNINEHLEWETV